MIAVPVISLKKLVAPALLIAVLAVSSIGFTPKAGATGSTPGNYTYLGCEYRWHSKSYNVAPSGNIPNQSFLLNSFCLTSTTGRFKAIFQGDGNFVVYDGNSAIWSSNTWGKGARRLTMQNDGNIVIYNGNSQPLWNANTWGLYNGTGNNTLYMQDDGNLVLYKGFGSNLFSPMWATGTNR